MRISVAIQPAAIVSVLTLCFILSANAETDAVETNRSKAAVIGTYSLTPTRLEQFGNAACSREAVERARQNGLRFADLPSIGSGLAKASGNGFYGITDRGPNGSIGDKTNSRRTFPLPYFCPAIVRFDLTGERIQLTKVIPLRDTQGNPISGLSNLEGEERLYESADAESPLPLDPNGVDPEGIRVLPGGNFLLSEEYSPSILVVSSNGQVLVRYTPIGKPLTNAGYPVKAILPAVFAQRRVNKGFENLALSSDGRFAYAILQSPMGDEKDKRFRNSRVIRALKLDVSDLLNAKVAGEYLVSASSAQSYSETQRQEQISWSDADWIATDKLVVVERGKGEAKLLLVDLSNARNVLGRSDEGELLFENVGTDLSAFKVRLAQARQILSTRELPEIDSEKIEGLAVLGPNEVALANDNDFGIGENANGQPSKLWLIRLAEPLPVSGTR
jgi:hypothetical protein